MNTKRIFQFVLVLAAATLFVWISVSWPDSVFPALNALLMIAFGLGIGILLRHKFGLSWGLYGIGAVTFILSQVGHIPFNTWVLNPLLTKLFPQADPGSMGLAWWSLFLGLSAGIFEETARYLVMRFWRKDIRNWEKSMMFGAGHGGVEAIIIGVLAFVAFIQLSYYRQIDLDTLASAMTPEQLGQLKATVETFWSNRWYEHLWGALERFNTIPVHLAATVLVYRGVRDKNALWYLAAVAWHTFVDAVAVFASQTWGIPLTELLILGFGLSGWGIVFWTRKIEPISEPDETKIDSIAPEAFSSEKLPVEDKKITKESLEDSRYE